jgi:class 3 adenylate cyclase
MATARRSTICGRVPDSGDAGMTACRLAAILAADVFGYSRLMGVDEVATPKALKTHRREVVNPAITATKSGRVSTRSS